MKHETDPGLRDYVGALKRRRRAASIVAVASATIAVLLALLLPPQYRSAGTILIEQQELPTDLVRSTITSYADQRVQVIAQRVMTTQQLLEIMRRFDLYPRERQRQSREEVVERMRRDIDVSMISADVVDPRSGLPRAATIAFNVAYTSRSPEHAVQVANELTTLFLNESLTERTRLAGEATSFLEAESQRLSAEIAELEQRLALFKEANEGALPELQLLNIQLLDRTEQELRQLEARRASLEQQRTFLEAQLAQISPHAAMVGETGERIMSPTDRLRMLRSSLASAEAVYSDAHPDVVRLRREIAGLEREVGAGASAGQAARDLDQARGELAAARERYGPEHPDVARLERRVAALAAGYDAALEDPPAPARAGATSADNPAWVQINAQLTATLSDLRATDAQAARVRAQRDRIEGRLLSAPQVEREYRELARNYDAAQLKFQEVRAKLMEAELARNLEQERKGERFTLIEPPLAPEAPVSPNRIAILVIGLVLTVALAAATVAVLESLDATVRGRQDLLDVFGRPPLALVPDIASGPQIAAGHSRSRVGLIAAASSVVVVLALVHVLYRPLDLLWVLALRRIGLY